MTIKALLSFLPSFIYGYCLICLAFPESIRSRFFFKVFAGMGLGVGISSCLYFLFRLVFFPYSRWFIFVETILCLCVVIFVLRTRRMDWIKPNWPLWSPFRWTLTIFFGFLLIVVLVSFSINFLVASFMVPNGDFDAWTVWNLRARFIDRAGVDWLTAFSSQIDWRFHADYPLLIPISIVKTWQFIGNPSQRVPIVLAGIFSFGLVGVLVSSLWNVRSVTQALLAGLILLATPRFLALSTFQIADLPLAFYMVCALIFLYYFFVQYPGEWGLLALGESFAAFAAWTKNEGLLFWLIFTLVIIGYWFWRRRKNMVMAGSALIGGMLIPLVAIAVFKIYLAPAGDLFPNQTTGSIFTRVLEINRYGIITQSFFQNFITFGKSSIPLWLIGGLYLFGMGLKKPGHEEREAMGLTFVILLLMLAGYFGVYLITPNDVDWQLKYSADRLFMHLFPATVWLLGILTRSPEDAISFLSPSLDLEKK